MNPIRVLIADDHPLIIEGLATALARFGITVVAHVHSPDGLPAAYAKSSPDVVVLDIRFGEMASGLDAARAVLAADPQAAIVFYSQFDQDELVREAYRLGGMGFVTKNQEAGLLAEAINAAARRQTYFLPDIAKRLALIGVHGDESPMAKLDARELEVFRRIAQGQTNLEIADAMELSAKTISNVSQAIKERLGVHRPADIARLAIRHKVIEP
jgi:two-component system, NarL family, invasion response regulator UvrY